MLRLSRGRSKESTLQRVSGADDGGSTAPTPPTGAAALVENAGRAGGQQGGLAGQAAARAGDTVGVR